MQSPALGACPGSPPRVPTPNKYPSLMSPLSASPLLPTNIMDGFRFILENPHPNATNNKQRKRARLVTACDSCRIKKIKCQQSTPNARCEACKAAKTPCLFGDRDRYQAERGVTCTWNPAPLDEVPASPEGSSRKRKLSASPPATENWAVASGSAQSSRAPTPAIPNYRYLQPEQLPGPSSTPPLVHELNVFPPTAVPSQDNASVYDLPLFDPTRPRFPHPLRMHYLGALFFDRVGAHFPFLDRHDVLHRIQQRTCSAILSNCIAGLAARFADPSRPNPAAGAPFYDMAKTLAAHVVSVPSVEALHALICITWAEYGSGHDAGFWMYSRMAIAMCLDLGLGNEATIRVAATPEVRNRLRLTWWQVVCVADIAASWATGRPATLDLNQFDTALPPATDDLSLLIRNSLQLFIIRGRLSRVLDAHVENQSESSLDWDLSELQADLKNMSANLPPSLVFNEENLVQMRERRLDHHFVYMHLFIQAVKALVNRPSLLPSYGLPGPLEGPRAETARTCAKSIVEILMTVDNVAPHEVQDPFLDLPLLVASRSFIAEGATPPPAVLMTMSPRSSLLARQWCDTFLNKCKDALVRLSSAWGGPAVFESILDQHGGTLADDLQLAGTSSIDRFAAPNNWLMHPGLVDDCASDTSSSFRSSSRELSPHLPPTTCPTKFTASSLGGSPLVRQVDEPEFGLDMSELARRASEFFVPGSLDHEVDAFNMSSFMDEPCALHLAIDSSQALLNINTELYARKDDILTLGDKQSPQGLFSPLPWLSRT